MRTPSSAACASGMGAAPRTPSRVGSSSRVIASSIAAPAPLHCSIDLIATKKNLLVLLEAKMRARQAAALEFVTPQLRRRIEQVARIWSTSRHNLRSHA
ncbi:MAG: YraN family protein [Hyphomonadaceae bacterium]|nr:YraN family protein [Hyphomonadaceae bacterium]MBP9234916.1 YraN family protein [Hyphomonadaceae bacterium]